MQVQITKIERFSTSGLFLDPCILNLRPVEILFNHPANAPKLLRTLWESNIMEFSSSYVIILISLPMI